MNDRDVEHGYVKNEVYNARDRIFKWEDYGKWTCDVGKLFFS